MSKLNMSLLATATALMLAVPGVGGAQSSGPASDAPVAWGGDLFEYTPGGFTLTGLTVEAHGRCQDCAA
jgi:hypothetical protein